VWHGGMKHGKKKMEKGPPKSTSSPTLNRNRDEEKRCQKSRGDPGFIFLWTVSISDAALRPIKLEKILGGGKHKLLVRPFNQGGKKKKGEFQRQGVENHGENIMEVRPNP